MGYPCPHSMWAAICKSQYIAPKYNQFYESRWFVLSFSLTLDLVIDMIRSAPLGWIFWTYTPQSVFDRRNPDNIRLNLRYMDQYHLYLTTYVMTNFYCGCWVIRGFAFRFDNWHSIFFIHKFIYAVEAIKCYKLIRNFMLNYWRDFAYYISLSTVLTMLSL